MARVPLLLDVDTGIDDSLALLYACASPEAEIVAVTCVAGNVDARQVAENTRAVLELAGRADIEVALGREMPLVTLGPMTNLAIAVLVEPDLPMLLRRWVMMGGSYRSPGNTAPATEWNVSCLLYTSPS